MSNNKHKQNKREVDVDSIYDKIFHLALVGNLMRSPISLSVYGSLETSNPLEGVKVSSPKITWLFSI